MEGESEFSVLLFTVKSPECAIYICAGKETGVQGETIIQTSKTLFRTLWWSVVSSFAAEKG